VLLILGPIGCEETVSLDGSNDAGTIDGGTHDAGTSDGAPQGDGADGDDPDAELPVACTGAEPSFQRDIVPIVLRSCAGGEICHGRFGGTADSIYLNFVDAPLVRDPCDGIVVRPGDLRRSYLMNKLTGVGLCSDTQRMPLGASLATSETQAFADWICSGAPKN
jgi:hypothetical protein